MKATVIVKLKHGVLDPQGQAILGALRKNGYDFVEDIRTGKTFEIVFVDEKDYKKKIEKFSDELLANPIIESFEIVYSGD